MTRNGTAGQARASSSAAASISAAPQHSVGESVSPASHIAVSTAPAIAEERLSLTPNGNVRYQLKTPYRDGTTHVIFEEPAPAERRASMTWAQRLKRVFGIDIATCRACGGPVRIIVCIEDPAVIEKILTHLDRKAAAAETSWRPPCRAPPRTRRFD